MKFILIIIFIRVRVKRKFPPTPFLQPFSGHNDTRHKDTTQSFYSRVHNVFFGGTHYYNTINNTRPTLNCTPAHQHINTTIWILTTEEVNII